MLLHILFLFQTRSLASTQKRMDTNREDDTDCANLLYMCRPLAWKGSSAQHHNKKSFFKTKIVKLVPILIINVLTVLA
jgi:hypothetical protein